MSIALKTACWRFARVFVFGGAAALLAYLSGHLGDYRVPILLLPTATALLSALDKWVRERFKEAQDG